MLKHRLPIAFGVLLASAFVVAPAAAQEGYMFGQPKVSLTLRAGASQLAADGELFDFFTEELTLERDDFTAFTFGADVGIRIHPQADFVFSFAAAHSEKDSHFNDFVEDNGAEIWQTTELTRVPVTAGLKLHLLPRGRSISRYAFIPTRFSPYVGGGAGVMWYKLEQYGDFVDHETLDIFSDHFDSDGAALTANAYAGGDIWLGSRVAFNVEGRYNWADADLNDSFSDFDRIDLRGWQLTAGVTLRY